MTLGTEIQDVQSFQYFLLNSGLPHSLLAFAAASSSLNVSRASAIHLSFGQSIRLHAVHVCHLVLICVRFAVFFFVLHVSLAVFSSLTVRLHVCVC